MEFDFETLLLKQKELDAKIHQNHGVNYEVTKSRRLLAYLVELGELANATKTFKFWSLKPSESRERLLDEYADGLHFILSLVLAYDYQLPLFTLSDEGDEDTLTDKFTHCYQSIVKFSETPSSSQLFQAFSDFLALGQALSFTSEDIFHAYENKLMINYQRQNNKY